MSSHTHIVQSFAIRIRKPDGTEYLARDFVGNLPFLTPRFTEARQRARELNAEAPQYGVVWTCRAVRVSVAVTWEGQ